MIFSPCHLCHLHKTRRKQVVGHGPTPANVLLIGEAPGKTEDLLGLPFQGKSGRILHEAIQAARELLDDSSPTIFLTNTIQCIPKLNESKIRTPTKEEIEACRVNMQDTIEDVRPKRIILCGKVAQSAYRKEFSDYAVHNIQHPAFISRIGGTASPEFRAMVVGIKQALEGSI